MNKIKFNDVKECNIQNMRLCKNDFKLVNHLTKSVTLSKKYQKFQYQHFKIIRGKKF